LQRGGQKQTPPQTQPKKNKRTGPPNLGEIAPEYTIAEKKGSIQGQKGNQKPQSRNGAQLGSDRRRCVTKRDDHVVIKAPPPQLEGKCKSENGEQVTLWKTGEKKKRRTREQGRSKRKKS